MYNNKKIKYPIYKNPISLNPENGCSCMRVFTVTKLSALASSRRRRGAAFNLPNPTNQQHQHVLGGVDA